MSGRESSLPQTANSARQPGGTPEDPAPAIIADMHSHTAYSHGQADSAAMLESARKAGLRIFGFSEHSPRPEGYGYPQDYQDRLKKHLPDYIDEVLALAGRERDTPNGKGLRVLLGIEIDYLPGQEDFARELAHRYPFDYCIGGLHFQQTWGFDFSPADWETLDEKARFAVYERYYADLTSLCRSGIFHIVAHPDLVKLFSKGSFDAWLESGQALSCVRETLTVMRDNGLLMEVSSAGLRKPCEEIYPGPRIMSLAAELGVSICFGSDAHCANTPAFAFNELARYAASFGYTQSHIVANQKTEALAFTPPKPL